MRLTQWEGWLARILDLIALSAVVVILLLMGFRPALTGLEQRGMFLVAYVWYGVEAHRLNFREVS